jgi:hypothetical protein
VLIFSQMVRCLDILEDYLIQRRWGFHQNIDPTLGSSFLLVSFLIHSNI